LQDNDFPKRFGFGFMAVSSKLLIYKPNDSVSEGRDEENWVEVKSESRKTPRYNSRSGQGGGRFRLHNLRSTEQFRLCQHGHAQPN
jgi:hypothetical protein